MDYYIESDLETVWVQSEEGTLGRFGLFGVDIHTTISEQLKDKPVCLACTHIRTTFKDWKEFQSLMLKFYNVVIPDTYTPKRFLEEKCLN